MLKRLGLQTAGESHGRGMLATLTGLPAGVPIDGATIDAQLARRQAGYGRSARQRLEHDRVDILAGVYRGRTSGAPLVLAVWNVDDSLAGRGPLTRPRPGHADLAGGCKTGSTDMRPILERASARETAARVAAGSVAAGLLGALGIEVLGHVVALGGVTAGHASATSGLPGLRRRVLASSMGCAGTRAQARCVAEVDRARRAGDSLGGVIEVLADGVPPGLGSLSGWETRLDARLGAALLSIQAIKAVEIGDGTRSAGLRGSQVHDGILAPGPEGPRRASNRAGGVEGGMSNGQRIVVRAWMKPLSTLRKPLRSWDYSARRNATAFFERSDVTAVPAAAVVAEAMIALVLLDALLEVTGGDSLGRVRRSLSALRRDVARDFGRAR